MVKLLSPHQSALYSTAVACTVVQLYTAYIILTLTTLITDQPSVVVAGTVMRILKLCKEDRASLISLL